MQMFYDVVVYGGTSAGVIAAVQAARMGKKVVLLEPGERLGGMTSSGLTATDVGNEMVIGGLAKEFYERLYQYYQLEENWIYEKHETYIERVKKHVMGGGDELTQMRWVFEPHAAELIFQQWMDEAGVTVMYREQLDLHYGVIKMGDRIQSIRMESGVAFVAKVFIDATYEGDLMAAAGVSYTVGREPNRMYGETLNGIRHRNMQHRIDPYIVQGNRSSGLLPYVEKENIKNNGEGDHRIQPYTFRLTLTDVKENQIPIEKPPFYNPLLYELQARKILAQWHSSAKAFMPQQWMTFTPMPNRKTDTDKVHFIGASHEWPDGNYDIRDQLWQEHRNYVHGLLWFLGNDPRVPEPARQEMKRWGLAADEYKKNDHWPTQLYVREARRMISDFVMTEHHVKGTDAVSDVIGLGSHPIQGAPVALYVHPSGWLASDGEMMSIVKPYPISYKAIVPKEKECINLITPTALSATHVAFASISTEPTFMILAQAAGTIAAMAIDEETAVQRLHYHHVKSRLLQDGQILALDEAKMNELYANYLFDQRVIHSLEIWHQDNEGDIHWESLKSLILRAANKFRPAGDVIDALRILHEEGIQTSKTNNWLQTIVHSESVPRALANQLMRDIARRLANYEKYSVVQM